MYHHQRYYNHCQSSSKFLGTSSQTCTFDIAFVAQDDGTNRNRPVKIKKKKECSHLTYYVYLKTLWTNKGEFGAHFEPIVQALDSAHLFIAYEQCNCDGLVYSWTLLQWNKNQIVMFGSLPLIEATMLVIMNIGRPSQRRNNARIFDASSVLIVVSGWIKNHDEDKVKAWQMFHHRFPPVSRQQYCTTSSSQHSQQTGHRAQHLPFTAMFPE